MKTCFVVFIAFLAMVINLTASPIDEFKVSHLTVLDGLPQSNVRCIVKDANDYIWMGTKDGLCRYNGVDFTVYKHANDATQHSICNNIVNCLHASNNGELCIGTDKGLSLYSSQTDSFRTIDNEEVASSVVNDICALGESQVLIATNKGCYWLSHSHNSMVVKEILVGRFTQSLAVIDSTRILLGRGKSLYQLDMEENGIAKVRELLKLPSAINSIMLEENNLFLGTQSNGLFHYNYENNRTNSIYNYAHETFGEQFHPILDMVVIDSELWVGTENGGLYIINWTNRSHQWFFQNIKSPKGLSSNSIYSIYPLSSTNVWLGTHSKGVNIYDPNNALFTTIDSRSIPAIDNNYVKCFCESEDGNIAYVGTDGGGVFQWNRQTNVIKKLQDIIKDKIPNEYIQAIVCKGNTLWLGSYLNGLLKVDLVDKTVSQIDYYKQGGENVFPDKIWSLFMDSGDKLWIGTIEDGLFVLDVKTEKIERVRNEHTNEPFLVKQNITAIAEDEAESMWIGTADGLIQINKKNSEIVVHTSKNTNGALPNDNISSLYVSSSGVLWIGTINGLTYYDSGKGFGYLKRSDEFANKTIKSIVEDETGAIWLSTNKGIVKFEPSGDGFLSFDHTNGLPGNEFYLGAGFKSTSGELYFGSNNGMVYFDAAKITDNIEMPEIKIEALKVFNKTISPGDESGILSKHIQYCDTLHIHYKHKVVTFEFIGISYPSSPKNEYAYFLENFEEEWNYVGNRRSATYTNLKPGTYKLKIKATNGQRVWSDSPKELVILVEPPFWYTSYAFVLYIVFIVLVLLVARKVILMPVKHNEEIRIERLKRSQEEQLNKTRLQFFTNISHEFRTPLTLIIGPLETLKNKKQWNNSLDVIYENAQHLLNMINELLEFRKIENKELNLKFTTFSIQELINGVAFLFRERAKQNNIDLEIKIPQKERYVYLSNEGVKKILMNLLSNAFKYTPEGGKVSIVLEINEALDVFKIAVNDNGKGIDVNKADKIFHRFFSEENSNSTGIGLEYAHKLAIHQRGELNYRPNQPKGSSFEFTLPMNSDKFNVGLIPPQLSDLNKLADAEPSWREMELLQKFKILIVDDNPGILNLLEESLGSSFDLLKAFDGETAFSVLKTEKPHLVISDVMMPGMNGFELCKAIKNDLEVSHIPIILLTALDSEESEYIGLEHGADDYISKPFNPSVLKQRALSRITFRELIIAQNKTKPEMNFSELATTKIDDEFIAGVIDFIHKNISESDLNVEKLADSLHVSRSFLYKKVKTLTGYSATEFIRTVKLKKAAQLLKESGGGIAQIAYEVGFSSPSYFSKCFKQLFGVSPNEYLENNT